jgi:hypothetical protein
MTTRVSNLASNKLVQSTILRTQDRILDRQLQISTLQKSQDYAGIADETNRLVTMEASRRKVEQFMTEGTNVKLRMDTMLNSLDSLKTTLKDVEGLVRDLLDDGTLPDGIDKDEFCNVKLADRNQTGRHSRHIQRAQRDGGRALRYRGPTHLLLPRRRDQTESPPQ